MYYQVQPGNAGNPAENFHLVPKIDVLESSDEVIYLFEMPGVEEQSVNVEVKDGMLYVGGDAVSGVENESYNILYQERESIRKYRRVVSLPLEADSEQAAAIVKNGMLTVRFPRKKGGRRLPINQPQQYSAQNSYNNQTLNMQNVQNLQTQNVHPQNMQQG